MKKNLPKQLLLAGITLLAFKANSQNLNLPLGKENQAARFAQRHKEISAAAQGPSAKVSSASYTDTLYYFLNKQYYRIPSPGNFAFNTFLLSSLTSTGATYVGSIFLNTGTVNVTGAEILATRKNTSASASIPVKIYLCNVNASNLPLMPPVDSISTICTNTSFFITGNFPSARTMTTNYAVLYKNASTTAGDTMVAQLTNALTPTASSTNTNAKFGEGLSVLRFNGSFLKTTNAFGTGSENEFIVAPRVNYSISTALNSPTLTVCTSTAYTFTNTSSALLNHRQYNLNAFYNVWKPFGFSNAVACMKPDSVFTWKFGDGTRDSSSKAIVNITKTYATAGTYTVSLTSKFQKMSGYLNISSSQVPNKLSDVHSYTLTAKSCAVSHVGIQTISGYDQALSIYPNPAVNGKATLSGLQMNSEVLLFNMQGQLLLKQIAQNDNLSLDLSEYPAGNYFIRVISSNDEPKVMKVINTR